MAVRRALPFYAVATLVTGILAWCWRFWVAWLAFGLSSFTLVGDLVNVVFCRAALARAEGGRHEAEPAAGANPAGRGPVQPLCSATEGGGQSTSGSHLPFQAHLRAVRGAQTRPLAGGGR